MSSSNLPGNGGDKKGCDDKLISECPLSFVGSHGHILSQQPMMDIKTLQNIRPKINPSSGVTLAHAPSALPPIMPQGRVTSQGDGHLASTTSIVVPTAASHGAMPVSLAQPNTVHLGSALPLNVIRNPVAQHSQFTSHLPRGAIAAASALTKTGPNIAIPAPSMVRSPLHIPHTAPTLHTSGGIAMLQHPLGRSSALTTIKQGLPSVTQTPTVPLMEAHRSVFGLHGQPPTTTQNVQITLATSRSTTAVEIPKSMNTFTHHKTLNIPTPIMQPSTKVIVSQPVNPLLHQPLLTKSVNLSVGGHVSSVTALPPIATTTAVTPMSAIPVAKVTPQRQIPAVSLTTSLEHDLSRQESSASIYISQSSHRTVASSVALTTNPHPITTSSALDTSRSVGNIPTLPHFLPQHEWQNYPISYQQLVYPAAASPSTGTLIFPRPSLETDASIQSPSLAATLQAHALTSTVRFGNPMMMQVDPRHSMSAMHSQFAASVSSGMTVAHHDSKPVLPGCRTPPPSSHDGHVSVASSMYISSPQQPSLSNNTSASPRPSILRKRTCEGVTVKRPIGLMPDSHSPKPEPPQPQSNTSSPKTPAGDNNSQSSTDTALSSNDATTPTQNSTIDVKLKHELDAENGPSSLNCFTPSPMSNSVEASPRKKPRKQLLNATEELKDNTSSDEEMEKLTSSSSSFRESKFKEIKKEPREEPGVKEFVDNEGVRWTTEKKRANLNLLNFYNITWKSKNNHFLRFTDVKPKDERRPTVNELSNLRGIQQTSSGWKLFHMASQLENLNDLEHEMCSRISQLQGALEPRSTGKQNLVDDYDGILHELSQANIQRCQLIGDQLDEARGSMLKILDHKPRIKEIITKHMSKRPIKKKERT